MDDDVNRSSDSLPTSEEFELVGSAAEPELHIAGDVSEEQLQESLKEVLQEGVECGKMLDVSPGAETEVHGSECGENEKNHVNNGIDFNATENIIHFRGSSFDSKFAMYTTSPSPLDEDLMSISASLADGEYTVFDRITYLGGAVVSDPNSVIEIKRNMSVLNNQSSASALHISLSLPLNSEGCVILYEPSSSNEIASFPIIQIKAHIAGDVDTKEANCLTLVCSCSQGTIPDSTIFQCHVFRCEVPEAVSKIMQCFSAALKKTPKLPIPKSESFGIDKSSTDLKNNLVNYVFEGTLEFKEDDSKGGYANCPRDKDYFKLRSKLEKSVTLTVQQVSDNRELVIERCFGLLISPGRNVRNSDMQLVEMVSFVRTPGEKDVYTVTGLWDPNEEVFEVLNTETPKDTRVYMTIAADLVIAGIQEPVRFVIETKAKIFPPTERFWYFSKKTLLENFYLRVKEMELDSGDHAMQVVSVTSTTKLQNKKASLSLNITKADSKATNVPTPSSPEDVDSPSDNDEPLLSGTGEVSKDCTETELEGWSEALLKWRQNLSQRPKNLRNLVRRGIPEALRGEVWQLLAGCHDHKQIVDTYKSLSNKDSSFENIIMRDINRTFPAHELFNEKNGTGQESLLKICKAYSIYDPEVGYCQGLSFLIAALLLHMPEEQAFGVFMKIMFDYSTRDMFRNGFEQLHLKFFQLQKLMEDQLPELASHFEDLGIEVHMFASQWFLTLFTAKFPLNLVFFIIDLFLLEGIDVIFQVAVALLMLSQKELLALDFEGVLKHFRVSLPKKYRSEDFAKLLIRNALKVKVKRLKKYERDYALFLNQEKTQEDPIKVLQRENKRLLDANLHLDRENDDLAHELINIKLQLRSDLVKSEDKVETLTKELQAASITIMELEEEKKRLTLEVAQLKEMCRRELQRAETESVRNAAIISDYKQICSQLSTRLEKEQTAAKQHIENVKDKIENCIECSKYLDLIAPTTSSKNAFKESQLNKENQTHEIENQARELELELARTKLALVEAECKNQDLTHQLNTAINELQTSKNTWLQKTFSSIRDVAKKDSIAAKEKDNS